MAGDQAKHSQKGWAYLPTSCAWGVTRAKQGAQRWAELMRVTNCEQNLDAHQLHATHGQVLGAWRASGECQGTHPCDIGVGGVTG